MKKYLVTRIYNTCLPSVLESFDSEQAAVMYFKAICLENPDKVYAIYSIYKS